MSDPTSDQFQKLICELRRQRLMLDVQSSQRTRKEEKNQLKKLAETNCSNPVVLKWLRENSFSKLVEMFNFFKKHIDEEEKKNHSDIVDITFMAHGSIRDFMIPASCLLPLASIRDVVLYAPWNCISAGAELTYAMATGKLKPQHRVFYCSKKEGCSVPDEKHRPVKLPDRWNSMKQAGDQMIPNISVSPLRPDDGVWESFEDLTKQYGPVGTNRIVIPFILPEKESVPFSVVTLALSLVLLQSRFKATVHLNACLADKSVGQKLDRKYLERQYACAVDDTGMKGSDDIFRQNKQVCHQVISDKTSELQMLPDLMKHSSSFNGR
ncbi:uncharacterized protein LOC122822005 [Gambusia affinis]|uniref:uncharacterized protein LOC122822005 n=1 Tax=Gambusia affinis TaxID=33528 RepID=UPI001CDB98A5|nr:uncharacterized protein LOC122822005 [Gambusia affinis]